MLRHVAAAGLAGCDVHAVRPDDACFISQFRQPPTVVRQIRFVAAVSVHGACRCAQHPAATPKAAACHSAQHSGLPPLQAPLHVVPAGNPKRTGHSRKHEGSTPVPASRHDTVAMSIGPTLATLSDHVTQATSCRSLALQHQAGPRARGICLLYDLSMPCMCCRGAALWRHAWTSARQAPELRPSTSHP